MRQLNHTLFVTEPGIELCLRGEALEAKQNGESLAHIPLHNLESIVTFAYKPASPQLMQACAYNGISFTVLNQKGFLRYKVIGKTRGNPELRLLQYRFYESEEATLSLAKVMINAKIRNSMAVVRRVARNLPEQRSYLQTKAAKMAEIAEALKFSETKENLRGREAEAARIYYETFSIIVRPKDEEMRFYERSRRPPTDPANALLSLSYTLLANQCFAALEAVGLDPFFGVLHSTRSGHAAMAYDLMEEMRPILVDRFVLRLLNLNIFNSGMFNSEGEEILLNKDGLKLFFSKWQEYQQTELYVDETEGKIAAGLIPYYQAQKLSRFIYRNVETYEPFLAEE